MKVSLTYQSMSSETRSMQTAGSRREYPDALGTGAQQLTGKLAVLHLGGAQDKVEDRSKVLQPFVQ